MAAQTLRSTSTAYATMVSTTPNTTAILMALKRRKFQSMYPGQRSIFRRGLRFSSSASSRSSSRHANAVARTASASSAQSSIRISHRASWCRFPGDSFITDFLISATLMQRFSRLGGNCHARIPEGCPSQALERGHFLRHLVEQTLDGHKAVLSRDVVDQFVQEFPQIGRAHV